MPKKKWPIVTCPGCRVAMDVKLVEPLEIIEYWFFGNYDGTRKRYHKFVHFYLLQYKSGDVADHDHEVEESRWVSIDEALGMLEFKGERDVVEKAREIIKEMTPDR